MAGLTGLQRLLLDYIARADYNGIKYFINKHKIDLNFGVILMRISPMNSGGSEIYIDTTNPLVHAVKHTTSIRIFELLLENDADINYAQANLISPLIVALELTHIRRAGYYSNSYDFTKYKNIVKLYIEAGRPIFEALYPDGTSILRYATEGRYPASINKMILEYHSRRNHMLNYYSKFGYHNIDPTTLKHNTVVGGRKHSRKHSSRKHSSRK